MVAPYDQNNLPKYWKNGLPVILDSQTKVDSGGSPCCGQSQSNPRKHPLLSACDEVREYEPSPYVLQVEILATKHVQS